MHRIDNVVDKLPPRLQPQAKRALHDMMYAKSRATCEATMQRFAQDYEAKYPKAVKALCIDVPRLFTHFDFPAAHWKHIRHSEAANAGEQGCKFPCCRPDDGVQAAAGCAAHVAPA